RRRPQRSTLFPYTTLFRSYNILLAGAHDVAVGLQLVSYKVWAALVKDYASRCSCRPSTHWRNCSQRDVLAMSLAVRGRLGRYAEDRKSTRLNSSHVKISYA